TRDPARQAAAVLRARAGGYPRLGAARGARVRRATARLVADAAPALGRVPGAGAGAGARHLVHRQEPVHRLADRVVLGLPAGIPALRFPVRDRLDAGADPAPDLRGTGTLLHRIPADRVP